MRRRTSFLRRWWRCHETKQYGAPDKRRRLSPLLTPHILLTATLRWPFAARLAMAFHRTGCRVSAVCPGEHPIMTLQWLQQAYRYSALTPLGCLRRAIEKAAPDLIVPCDDDAAIHLHLLNEQMLATGTSGEHTAGLIQRSLGSPAACALAAARAPLLNLASRSGLRVPASRIVTSADHLSEFMTRYELPVVLKADSTWGGLGVSIVNSRNEAQHAFSAYSAGPSLAKTMLRTALDRAPSTLLKWLKHAPTAVTVQEHIRGAAANRAVACWRGQVLAGVSVEALHTQHPTGPATVVRLIEHPEMSHTAASLVRHLGLSGLWGFDFVLDADGAAWLIEANPRATPICHLPLHGHLDLPAALHDQLTGESTAVAPASFDAKVVALFPGEWRRDPTNPLLKSACHDVPWGEPGLLLDSLRPSWEERGLLTRLKTRLRSGRRDRSNTTPAAVDLPLRSPPSDSLLVKATPADTTSSAHITLPE